MTAYTAICPECGAGHRAELVKCPSCHAFIIDASPWKSEFNLIAIPGTILTWGPLLLCYYFLPVDLPGKSIFADPISQLILGLGIYGILVLCLKWRITNKQNRAFQLVRQVCAADKAVDKHTLAVIREQLSKHNLGPYNQLIAYNRIHWIHHCQEARDDSGQHVLQSLSQHAEADWDALESSFAFTQFFVWLLPTTGFLGTVYGMTEALKSFSKVVSSSSDLGFTAGLTDTATGLGVAFHTTLVGLAAVIPLLALATASRRRSRAFLERVNKYFLRVVTAYPNTLNLTAEPVGETAMSLPEPPPPSGELPEPPPLPPIVDVDDSALDEDVLEDDSFVADTPEAIDETDEDEIDDEVDEEVNDLSNLEEDAPSTEPAADAPTITTVDADAEDKILEPTEDTQPPTDNTAEDLANLNDVEQDAPSASDSGDSSAPSSSDITSSQEASTSRDEEVTPSANEPELFGGDLFGADPNNSPTTT